MSVDVTPANRRAIATGAVEVRIQRWLFVVLSAIMFAVVLIAFAPTLYLQTTLTEIDTRLGNTRLPTYLVVHGAILTTWFALLVMQSALVRSRHVGAHRRLGVIGAITAAAVVASSAYTVANLAPRSMAVGRSLGATEERMEAFLQQYVVPIVVADVTALIIFTLFVGAALYWRSRPATHKRLMLLASVIILGPAFSSGRPVGRTLAMIMPETLPWRAFLVLCIAALVWHDRATRGRVEPATIWGSAALIVAVVLVGLVIESSGAVAHWLASHPF